MIVDCHTHIFADDIAAKAVAALREAGRTEQAMAEVETFLSESPGNPAALVAKGILHYLAGNRAKARVACWMAAMVWSMYMTV